ncbi:MAG: efflux transporter outer membrane subunit [Gemmatimonadales bacterium]
MRRVVAGGLLAAVLAGCSSGYRAPEVAPAGSRVGTVAADSLRLALDAIAGEPRTDTAGVREISPDTAGAVAWLDVFSDTVLSGLVRSALDENRDLRQAIARIREYRAQAGVAQSEFFPQISLNGAVLTQQIALGIVPPASFNAVRVEADATWELDFWGRIRRSADAARADLGAREEDRRAVILSLVSDVATAYLQLREYDAELDIARRTMASRQETLRLARRRFSEGVVSELDVRQFESEAAAAAASVAQFSRLVSQQENLIRVLLGRRDGAIPRGLPLDQVVTAVTVPDSLPASLIAGRPDVRRAERELAAAAHRAGSASSARLPRITVVGQYGSQSPDFSGLFGSNAEIYQLQGGISFPLFTGGRLRNQLRAAQARVTQAQAGYEQVVLSALRDVNDAMVGVRTSRDQVDAQRIQVDALRRGLSLAELRYRSGLSSYLEVLDAQRSLFLAEVGLAQVQRLQLTSTVQLYRALGGSWGE